MNKAWTQRHREDTEENHSLRQAMAQMKSITEMVAELNKHESGSKEWEEAERTIHEDPLSLEVRTDWYRPGEIASVAFKPAEFCILLCTGGPACRIIGELTEHGEPEKARIEHQDWGTPWTEHRLDVKEHETLLEYCRCFYYGE